MQFFVWIAYHGRPDYRPLLHQRQLPLSSSIGALLCVLLSDIMFFIILSNIHLPLWHNTNYSTKKQHQTTDREITPLAVISIFSLTLMSCNISTAARHESRPNLTGVLPHIEYPWAVSQLSKLSKLPLLHGSLRNFTYFQPGTHFIINVKSAKLLFNNAFVICDRGSWRG